MHVSALQVLWNDGTPPEPVKAAVDYFCQVEAAYKHPAFDKVTGSTSLALLRMAMATEFAFSKQAGDLLDFVDIYAHAQQLHFLRSRSDKETGTWLGETMDNMIAKSAMLAGIGVHGETHKGES